MRVMRQAGFNDKVTPVYDSQIMAGVEGVGRTTAR